MLLDVTHLVLQDNYKMLLTFENGEIKEFDCSSLFHEKPFEILANPVIFAQAKIEHGTVTWPNEIDIAPETLYLDSVSV
jgi:hypothetical protein